MSDQLIRCPWPTNDPIYTKYHDEEWGVPVYDDQLLLAKLILDGAQAGLSWITILKKRENYWAAFDNFDPEKMARYDDRKFEELMGNAGIVRNRQKINSAIKNAQAYLRLREETGESFSNYLWGFVGGKPIVNVLKTDADYLAISPESEAMSKDLKKRGFNFVGPTICYAFMQAVGMVNDHLVSCFRYEEIKENY
ncbi:MAG: DNA-3-methyladenine glycosylase I [Anaerolineae bacterium]|jgi:DNA-3-methyladenine glycosylase I|nr:DNA-3-methyladenine glycosylase I [Anaerolineae bacterium]MBT7071670.1 DNA-3-methyladenine glycosylase I [Anaerolineae bacterium]MBT7325196.1 DNA-3-methyladenine glycosylase I [Anaerolineae bacterium]